MIYFYFPNLSLETILSYERIQDVHLQLLDSQDKELDRKFHKDKSFQNIPRSIIDHELLFQKNNLIGYKPTQIMINVRRVSEVEV